MRSAAVLAVACVSALRAFASEPGSNLSCDDWVAMQPGIAVTNYGGRTNSQYLDVGGIAPDRVAIDNQGRELISAGGAGVTLCDGQEFQAMRVTAWINDVPTVLAELHPRCGARAGEYDIAEIDNAAGTGGCFGAYGGGCIRFDPMTGRVFFSYIALCTWTTQYQPPCDSTHTRHVCVITGLPTILDISETFANSAGLGFYVPYMPEGMGGADHFNTYWGPLTHPIDFTQAHPLQCGYPATQPHVGDYLTIADPLPTPEPGTGRYYITSATYQGQTRYGRKATNGHLSGRDPALLPACSTQAGAP